MNFTWLGFLVFAVLATIKGAQGDSISYSWFKTFTPLFIGLVLDGLLYAAMLIVMMFFGAAGGGIGA